MPQEIADALARLADLTNDELEALKQQIVDEFDRLDGESRSADSVALLEALADAQDAVDAEVSQRETAAAEAEERAEAARKRMHPDGAEDETDDGAGDGTEDETDETTETEGTEDGEEEDDGTPEAIAAAARRMPPVGAGNRHRPAGNRVVRRTSRSTQRESQAPRGTATLTVGQTFRGWSAGDEITSERDLATLFTERIKSLGRGSGERVLVASLQYAYPEERTLGSDPVENAEKMKAAVGYDAVRSFAASGGVCGPVNVDYSLLVLSSVDEPIAGALPDFNADRGGLRFMQPPTFAGVGNSGTGIWTEATDAAPGNATKPVQTISCGTEEEVFVDAIPTRLKFGNMQARFFPEMVEANTTLALANAARVRELNRLSKIATFSTSVSSSQLLGAARDLIATLDQTISAYRYRSRLDPDFPLHALLPSWTLDMVRADLVREHATGHDVDTTFAITNAQIEAWFTARNVTVTWFLDGQPAAAAGTNPTTVAYPFQGWGTQAPGALNNWPTALVWYLYAEGTFQRLNGGTMDLGVVRDSILDGTNDYETFIEIFEGIAMRGFESLQVISQVRPNGLSAGLVQTGAATVIY